MDVWERITSKFPILDANLWVTENKRRGKEALEFSKILTKHRLSVQVKRKSNQNSQIIGSSKRMRYIIVHTIYQSLQSFYSIVGPTGAN